jgi:hypothetical protein
MKIFSKYIIVTLFIITNNNFAQNYPSPKGKVDQTCLSKTQKIASNRSLSNVSIGGHVEPSSPYILTAENLKNLKDYYLELSSQYNQQEDFVSAKKAIVSANRIVWINEQLSSKTIVGFTYTYTHEEDDTPVMNLWFAVIKNPASPNCEFNFSTRFRIDDDYRYFEHEPILDPDQFIIEI